MLERDRHPHQYLLQDYSNPMLRNCIVIIWKRVCTFIPKPSSIRTIKPSRVLKRAPDYYLRSPSLASSLSLLFTLNYDERNSPVLIFHTTLDYISTNGPTTVFFPASTYSVCFSVVVLPKKSKSIWNHL